MSPADVMGNHSNCRHNRISVARRSKHDPTSKFGRTSPGGLQRGWQDQAVVQADVPDHDGIEQTVDMNATFLFKVGQSLSIL